MPYGASTHTCISKPKSVEKRVRARLKRRRQGISSLAGGGRHPPTRTTPLVLTPFCAYRSIAAAAAAVQVSELRPLLQGEDDEEEEDEEGGGAAAGAGGVEAPEQIMVFEAEEEGQPAYEPPPKKEVRWGAVLCCLEKESTARKEFPLRHDAGGLCCIFCSEVQRPEQLRSCYFQRWPGLCSVSLAICSFL